ncbi:hypothetical protein L798_11948 [Zootermopsis nevadensis]|uniref:Uncharacterized protein n=1 Tax=Zootermopsis nevadensis TaxID=136037 RepID=A0A067QEI9_ZOONE|nr:hypothetical protein L798_11948 [Zootermopsis nevadensis]
MGGVNLLPTNFLAEVSQLVHGFRLLRSTTLQPLCVKVTDCGGAAHAPCDLVDYLNGRMDGDLARESAKVTNTWIRLRTATRSIRPTSGPSYSSTELPCARATRRPHS